MPFLACCMARYAYKVLGIEYDIIKDRLLTGAVTSIINGNGVTNFGGGGYGSYGAYGLPSTCPEVVPTNVHAVMF